MLTGYRVKTCVLVCRDQFEAVLSVLTITCRYWHHLVCQEMSR